MHHCSENNYKYNILAVCKKYCLLGAISLTTSWFKDLKVRFIRNVSKNISNYIK